MIDANCLTPPALIAWGLWPAHLDPVCQSLMDSTVQPTVFTLSYFATFALTCLLEFPFYWQALRKRNSGLADVVCNACTHPIVYFVFPYLFTLGNGRYGGMLAGAEIFAPVVEALVLIKVWRVSVPRAWLWSIAANLFSWWVGVYLA